MSNNCRNLFQFSDVISGGVFGISVLCILFSFIIPPVGFLTAAIIQDLNLGFFGLLFSLAFLLFTYLTYKRVIYSLAGHFLLIVTLIIFASGFPYFYTVLFLIYLLPYVAAYIEFKKT